MGLSVDSRPEVAALAAQMSLFFGQWQPTIRALASDQFRSQWDNLIATARQYLSANPNSAGPLLTSLQNEFGNDATVAFQLLLGSTQADLDGDGLANMVKQLDGDKPLAVRVLASHELYRITGTNLGYQPHNPSKASIQQWRRQLSGNKLNVLPVPDPVWERIAR
jgi:hypothetical protein